MLRVTNIGDLNWINFFLHDKLFTLTFAVLKFRIEMANHKATKKDVRQASKRRDRNRYNGKTTRNAIRDLKELKDNKAAAEQLPQVVSLIDRLAKTGVIHKNKAANLKSKLTKKVNGLATAATA
jgi:small subunit ribosomal protein S20